ncbi:DUF2637 domain-containing protein [Streptomyces europaeiscabiei]|uniref:DUF2637 domain-containing protein n=1 Tax=Streptomyces europaeiscabiei TaxID=146819 RepID=UPI0029BF14D7|nr:DUF2637 domain-containing protein [Streptomyces europaeiscabiei]MDX3777756.1 DUF2637 domain-containing protein [Streptomyces europaeiscabiei]
MKWDPSRALAVAAGLVIIALTAAAFWLSYAHLAEVALANGMEDKEIRAWAWPATLDLFIVAGELLMLRAALSGDVDPWAIGLTVVGSGSSIALNVAGVGTAAGTLDYVVAAVPPAAALLAFGALMRQIHQALAGRAASPVEYSEDVEVERVPDAVPDVPEAYPEIEAAVPAVPEAVPTGVRLLPIVARPAAVEKPLVLAAEQPRTRPEVHAEYVPDEVWEADHEYVMRSIHADEEGNPAQADPLTELGLGWAAEQFKAELLAGDMPSIRAIKDRLRVGQNRAKEIQDGFKKAQAAWRLSGSGAKP